MSTQPVFTDLKNLTDLASQAMFTIKKELFKYVQPHVLNQIHTYKYYFSPYFSLTTFNQSTFWKQFQVDTIHFSFFLSILL